jgi:hypothetical protein
MLDSRAALALTVTGFLSERAIPIVLVWWHSLPGQRLDPP